MKEINTDTLEGKIAIMNAALDGAKIEYTRRNLGDWRVCSKPNWNWEYYHYRIAVDPFEEWLKGQAPERLTLEEAMRAAWSGGVESMKDKTV